jgi:uncharacterized protein YndB with AHSA1/START domain
VTKDPGAITLELTRWLPAQPPAVFAAFSEAEELASWWGPVGFTVPSVDFDPRAGATYRIEMQPPEGESFHLVGEFRAVDPPTHLAYSFLWEPPDPDDVETVVDLRFRDVDGSTEVAFTQGPFRTETRRALHRDGWTETFDRLERHLRSGGRAGS